MSEELIERHVEYRTNELDRRYMAGDITEQQYRKELREIDSWAEREAEIYWRAQA